MAILSDASDSEDDVPDVPSLLKSLAVPSEYARYDALGGNEIYDRLDRWKGNALTTIKALREALGKHGSRSIKEQSDIVAATTAFISEALWTNGDLRYVAEGESLTYAQSEKQVSS